jgi:hypothetical protein
MSRRQLQIDVLGEVRRAMRILRRVEKYLVQQEREAKRTGKKRQAKFEHDRDVAARRAGL